MEGEATGRSDVQGLLQAITVSKVLESRIRLIAQLGELGISDKSDLACIAECLAKFWEETECLEVLQCKFNTTILHVAAKYVELGSMSDSQGQFLVLATKASSWCGRHLQMSVEPIQVSQDEHSDLRFQLVLDSLNFSSATFSALTRSPMPTENILMLIIENFVSEQMNLIKTSISEIKRIHSVASEVLKVAQEIVDAAIKLCRSYSQAIKCGSSESTGDEDRSFMDGTGHVNTPHIINVVSCTIENLYELGIVAATGGGSLVTILNISWKGVITLLQLDKVVLANKINIPDIILTLVSLANESLRCAAEAWSSIHKGGMAETDAKRYFLPIKFYLINAVRISSRYPDQALRVYKEITLCVLKISALGLELSKETHLRAASEALTEFLGPASFLLLHTLLYSAEVEHESKIQVLDWLFPDESHLGFIHSEKSTGVVLNVENSMDEILMVTCDSISKARILNLGRLLVFMNLLKSSADLKEEVVLGISRKLGYLLDFIIDENVFSSILVLHIPVLWGSGAVQELSWQPIFPSLLHALETFMVVASVSPSWVEVEVFLFSSFLHPHFLCQEIVMELWCFLVRHSDAELVNYMIDKLCSLLKSTASLEQILLAHSAARKISRLICTLLTYATQATTDRIYNTIANDDKCHSPSIMFTALIMEGFPLSSLSDTLKKSARQRILTDYCGFIENNLKKLGEESSSRLHGSGMPQEPIYAFSSALRNLQINSSDISDKHILGMINFTVAVLRRFRSSSNSLKDHYCKLLSQALEIIANTKRAYSSDEIEGIIFELQNLVKSGSTQLEKWFHQLKPAIASFLAALSHVEIEEDEGKAISSAVWGMYHVILKERHWAFIHLALAAFGYFAARTSCKQLWRFVPQDAALSFDMETGKVPNEERFMSELKAFLEKEVAFPMDSPCKEQLGFLVKEGLVLKEMVGKKLSIKMEACRAETLEVDDDGDNCVKKKRKIPNGMSKGMSLLQRGLAVMQYSLADWKQEEDNCKELQKELSTHLSCLEDVIHHLIGLSDR